MTDNSHVPPQASRSELEPHVKDAAKLFGVANDLAVALNAPPRPATT
jgi:hypothetical protein